MKQRDHSRIIAELYKEYEAAFPRSAELNARAKKYQIDGGSHGLRLISPFPPRIASAHGAWVQDVDQHNILDFWQGHYVNILGHNPPIITQALAKGFQEGFGLQTGFTDELQVETAEILCKQTGMEKVRFTTCGTLATMYSIMLARAFTGRDLVMKVGGGWHGGQPWGLYGVHYKNELGFENMESAGLPGIFKDSLILTEFNNTQLLHEHFGQFGDRMACFIVEIFMGAGGYVPATNEYVKAARDLADKYGVILIIDEVISGFRFRAGGVAGLYNVKPDLSTFGKVIGGGMPVAAVVGRADIMELVGKKSEKKVGFSGGTYSAHPSSFLAAKTLMEYLVANEADIYPRLGVLGDKTRSAMEKAFLNEGIYARCSGDSNDILRGSSLGMLLFPYQEGDEITGPQYVQNPNICDVQLTNIVLQIALLLENVHVVHGLGAVSLAHTESDIEFLGQACQRVARRIKNYL